MFKIRWPLIFILLFVFSESYALSRKKIKIKIKIKNKVILVEVAKTEKELREGLMFRKKLEKDSGMLFIYPEEQLLSFWMKNTFIPLSIGFFNKKRELINIEQMKAVASIMETPSERYKSAGSAKYALEMNQGWFKKNKVRKGKKFHFID